MRRKRNLQRIAFAIYNVYIFLRTKAHIWPFESTSTPIKKLRQKRSSRRLKSFQKAVRKQETLEANYNSFKLTEFRTSERIRMKRELMKKNPGLEFHQQ